MTRILYTISIVCLACGFANAQEVSENSVMEPISESIEPISDSLNLDPIQMQTQTDFQENDALTTAPQLEPGSNESSSLLTDELNMISPTTAPQPSPVVSPSGCNCDQNPSVATVSYNAPLNSHPAFISPAVYPNYAAPNFNRLVVPNPQPVGFSNNAVYRPFYGPSCCTNGVNINRSPQRRGFLFRRPLR